MASLTIDDIATIAGVSRATVSRVINNQKYVAQNTKSKVEAVIKEHHFVPNAIAQGLKTSSRSIGVVSLDITNQYFTQIIYSIEKKLRESNYLMYYLNSDNDALNEEKALFDLISKRVDGIILLSTMCGKKTKTINLVKNHVPVVVVEGFIDNIDSVNTNNAEGTRAAIEYFIACGHTKIAFCANTLAVESYNTRFQTYQKIMQEQFGKHDSSYDFIGTDYIAQLNQKMGTALAPTAIFCVNDSHALKVYDYCYDNHYKIPQDLSVIGFDDLPISKLVNPQLTTISIPVNYMGEIAAQFLLDRINRNNDETQGVNIEIPVLLKNRDSVLNIRL